ncbi:MAG: tRNA 5-methoxyuridine(34)/uridine 5-oxyacetic acid(34) synthase CmoB [Piscirickettsiaceae bacterium]|nr:tRNA 5-methoxyuridine(34)/uridine 5-oxyacetic acid(34) synthase CmoB [Piscirickettsiaceae bacterium]
MIYRSLYDHLDQEGLSNWSQLLKLQVAKKLSVNSYIKWLALVSAFPDIHTLNIDLKNEVKIGIKEDLNGFNRQIFINLLKQCHPWRKGPFIIFDIVIDTEWRSDWKWDRLISHIQPLSGRKVLDIGSGNGYYGWRMIGENAKLVIGVDTTFLFIVQYQIMQKYSQIKNYYVLPIGIEYLPENLGWFDTVFSMGVLYHRRSPLEHLYKLKACLKPGGELVLETLIIDGKLGTVLLPTNRYAKMNNVWFIPSNETMRSWLQSCGFENINCININNTTLYEQRATDWMTFESLSDFLDSNDITKTIEGYSSPRRALYTASITN